MNNKKNILKSPYIIVGIVAIIVIFISIHSLLLKAKTFDNSGISYTHYNNYLIFKQSFFHLIENKDLYKLYPQEHWDYFKYSPTFSLLMAPIAVLPNYIGLILWNLLNAFVLFFAISKLPITNYKSRIFIFLFLFIELVTSLQNAQSNALIAGLIIFSFIFLEQKKPAMASLFIVLTIFIKLFGGIAFILFIFYPHKIKAFLFSLGWTIALTLIPLLVVSASQLLFLYKSWFLLLQSDHSISYGLSVSGWLFTWFNLNAKNIVFIIGVLLLGLPLLRFKNYNSLNFKLNYLSAVLIWMVIFNHKAESPTFVIAITGVSLWFFSQKQKLENTILLIFAAIFTILSPTDLFPKSIRNSLIIPYVLKAVPCIFIWSKIIFDMLRFKAPKNI